MCPWAVKGHIISLHQQDHVLTFEEILFHATTFWVQAHNIPRNRMSTGNAVKFDNHIGVFVQEHQAPKGLPPPPQYFLQFKVLVDTRVPLKMGVYMKREDGSMLWISIKYERLSDFCFDCGKLGHSKSACVSDITEKKEDPHFEFGPWLRTPPTFQSPTHDIPSAQKGSIPKTRSDDRGSSVI